MSYVRIALRVSVPMVVGLECLLMLFIEIQGMFKKGTGSRSGTTAAEKPVDQ